MKSGVPALAFLESAIYPNAVVLAANHVSRYGLPAIFERQAKVARQKRVDVVMQALPSEERDVLRLYVKCPHFAKKTTSALENVEGRSLDVDLQEVDAIDADPLAKRFQALDTNSVDLNRIV